MFTICINKLWYKHFWCSRSWKKKRFFKKTLIIAAINTFSTLIFNQYRTSKMFVSVVYTSFCYSTRIELRNTGTLLTKLCVFISCVLIGFEVQDYLYFSVNTKVKLDIGFGLYGLTVCKAFIKRLWLFFLVFLTSLVHVYI